MRRTNNARRGLGIRGQLMFFLCFICLFLLVLFWILSTQLLEPLYTRHIERQLTTQAENVVSQLDDALAEGTALSSWSFGRLYVNTGFFDKLAIDLYSKGALSSFCVDISDSTLRQIYKIENQSYCNLHETYLSDASSNEVVNTAIAMRKKCRTSPGGFKQTLNPPRLSGSAQLLVGRTTADGSYGRTGFVTDAAREALAGVDTLLLEANHDVETLQYGPYPYFLKRRILGDEGHLSNDAAAEFARLAVQSGTRDILLAHLSKENNTPELAEYAVARALQSAGLSVRLGVAPRDTMSEVHLCRRSPSFASAN